MSSKKRNILDYYFAYPIQIDLIINLIVYWSIGHIALIPFKPLASSDQLNLISNLIATMISLAGFMLAALTIIASFKANLKSKGIEESDNALELILSSNNYSRIVNVFKHTIIELVLYSILTYIIWNLSSTLPSSVSNHYVIVLIFTATVATLRSLYILFTLLSAESKKRED